MCVDTMLHQTCIKFGKLYNALILCMLLTMIPAATGKSLLRNDHHRQVADECDMFDGCYFLNIQTRDRIKLIGNDTIIIDPPNNEDGYSIGCDIIDTSNGDLNVVKFTYNNITHEEFDKFRYMNGDGINSRIINPVSYFDTCGNKKVLVEGRIWTAKCFEMTYDINLVCSCPTEIGNFILVDATRRKDIMELNDYDQDTMPQNLTIRAIIPQCAKVGVNSVLFELDGVVVRCESFIPYSLFGDSSRSDVTDLNRANYYSQQISIGTHTIRATPFSSKGCTGTAGKSLMRKFTVTP
jgi:large repetitive protein